MIPSLQVTPVILLQRMQLKISVTTLLRAMQVLFMKTHGVDGVKNINDVSSGSCAYAYDRLRDII